VFFTIVSCDTSVLFIFRIGAVEFSVITEKVLMIILIRPFTGCGAPDVKKCTISRSADQ